MLNSVHLSVFQKGFASMIIIFLGFVLKIFEKNEEISF